MDSALRLVGGGCIHDHDECLTLHIYIEFVILKEQAVNSTKQCLFNDMVKNLDQSFMIFT